MSETFPVFIQHEGKRVPVGVATRAADGFNLALGNLSIGSTPIAAPSLPPYQGDLPTTFPNYGRSKGGSIFGASQQDLEYYANGARRSLADPSKARWHDKEQGLLAAIDTELVRQSGEGGGFITAGGPPPHDDEELPF